MSFGLALAGGGIKGAAHIGVLKALEEENIKIDYISGASSGSIVAALYAAGFTPDEIYEIFKKYCKAINYVEINCLLKTIIGLIINRKLIIKGVNCGGKLEKLINKACKEKDVFNIKDIKMPLVIPSVDLNSGGLYIFSSSEKRITYSDKVKYINDINIGKAVRASCSYPGIFCPVKYNDVELIDGGVRENIPWKENKKMGADKNLCVVFEKQINRDKRTKNLIEVIINSIDIMGHELSNYELKGANYVLKIKTAHISLLDKKKIKTCYEKGYFETKKNIDKIKNKLKI